MYSSEPQLKICSSESVILKTLNHAQEIGQQDLNLYLNKMTSHHHQLDRHKEYNCKGIQFKLT